LSKSYWAQHYVYDHGGRGVDLNITFLKFDFAMVEIDVDGRAKHFAALHFFALPIPATP